MTGTASLRLFDLGAHQGVNDGQIISGIGETDRLLFPIFLDGLIQLGRTFIDDLMSPANGGGNDDL